MSSLSNTKTLPSAQHHLVLSIKDKPNNLEAFIAIHRPGKKKISFGATRLWSYQNRTQALKDALHLSKTMSYKLAMAGFDYGGAKGVIVDSQKIKNKNPILKSYLRSINQLSGQFITGADVGISKKAVRMMSKFSPYIVGVKTDPIKYTVLGLIFGLETALDEVFGNQTWTDRSFAIQGLGKIGSGLIRKLYRQAKKIYASDINIHQCRLIKKIYPKIEIVEPKDIYRQPVDVFSPCALSQSLNPKSVEKLRCQIILGGANNQLLDQTIGRRIYQSGIMYCPDYIVNAGGLISVVYEYEHRSIRETNLIKRIIQIKDHLKKVLKISKKNHLPPDLVADRFVEKKITRK